MKFQKYLSKFFWKNVSLFKVFPQKFRKCLKIFPKKYFSIKVYLKKYLKFFNNKPTQNKDHQPSIVS